MTDIRHKPGQTPKKKGPDNPFKPQKGKKGC
jgi:hypothetical protein